ncbi:MAG TPA: alpha/beta fold hydrolase [Caulobacteraceae bacterium]|nr:alpha/beta fold hydrolase [Caulobacteraceae bacterium]
MRSEKIEFANGQGQTLAARLDRPDGTARAYALFAHCFTCDKTAKAAVRISRALAGLGVGVLRFDFTGLGESEGELGGFSANVQDLIAAAAHMEALGHAPALLIGHSLGGAAVLAAAGEIASAKAVATIGAPAEVDHVLKLLGDGLSKIEAEGAAEVKIGGRPFTIRRDFVNDARMHDLPERVAHLHRALLVLHSPVDAVVGIDNASKIFLAARHPKSFISLDAADHLLTRGEDADYAATVIAAWASRYLPMAADVPAETPDGAVLVEETGAGKFQVQVSVHGTRFFADEPEDVGGLGSGPSPYELVSAGLGACTSMTLRLYAERKGWPLRRTRVAVRHDKIAGQVPPDTFARQIALEGPLDAEQTARLLEIADKCPVHRTLEGGARVTTAPFPQPPPATDAKAVETEAVEHFKDMDAECREADARG